MLARAGVTRSTMMGLPCLRLDGQFFGSFDRRTGDLLVKLPAPRVDQLVDAGRAHSFAPAGRRFREWAAISPTRPRSWPALLDEALAFVASQPPPPRSRRRATPGAARVHRADHREQRPRRRSTDGGHG
jgi:hypothetical protein